MEFDWITITITKVDDRILGQADGCREFDGEREPEITIIGKCDVKTKAALIDWFIEMVEE